jgi:xanthine/uracil/vitamin C permease (AzgA family)
MWQRPGSRKGATIRAMLEGFFGLRARGTTVHRELLGGATTFATMAYIIVVNPAILKGAIALALLCLSYYVFGLPH